MSTSAGSSNLNPNEHNRDRDTIKNGPNTGRNDHTTTNADHDRDHDRAVVTEDRKSVVDREKDEHGGIKFGSAFFGWLTATGMAVLLTALLAAAGTAVGLGTDTTIDQATSAATSADPGTVGWVGAAILAAILFLAYYCGGYVAGRMARFDGAKQGLAVWLWALIIAVILAVVGVVAGDQYNVLAQLNTFPRIPIAEGNLTTAGIIVAAAIALITLLAAILGGVAGMRFHRKVDKTGLGR